MKKSIFLLIVLALCSSVQAELVSQWKLDGNTLDSVGTNHGTAIGGPLTYVPGTPNGADPGGQALDLNGSSQGVSVPHHSSLKPVNMSICAWIKQDVYTTKWQNIVRKEDGGSGRYLLEVGEEGPVNGIYCGFVINGVGYQERGAAVSPAVLTDGHWHHAATTYDGSYMKIYFDGEEIGSWAQPGMLSTSGTAPVQIGKSSGECFNGGIDDVRIYSHALSETEIAGLAGVPISAAYNPTPTNGASGVNRAPTLNWMGGYGAFFHHVYFGTDYNEVNKATDPNLPPIGRGILPFGTETYSPSENPLEFATTYYWRIDEITASSTVKGDIWNFTVTERPTAYLKGDLNADLAVNFDDLMIFTGHWLQEIEYVDANCPDLDYSGVVDMYDFPLVATNWLQEVGPLVINEFMASNRNTLEDGDGNSPDWIELRNISNETINLEGWYLTDDANNLTKWSFPSGVTIDSGSYLIVFASGKEVSHYVDPLGYCHTNFELSARGAYLALVDPNGEKVVHDYISAALDTGENLFGYPRQEVDISYGLYENAERYFGVPTPGTKNDNPFVGLVADTKFNPDRGLYETPFDVTITCDTRGAVIYYTLDGSEPTQDSNKYTGPIPIWTITCLRAKAFKPYWMSSNADTQTYIFLTHVIHQPANPLGFPSFWDGTAADYEMASDVVDRYSDTIIDDLKTIPSISIVASVEDMFGSSGIYANPRGEGFAWERPCSLELINSDGSEGFQANCGLRIHGGGGRSEDYKKHGFRALFKSIYGPSKLLYKLFPDTEVDSFDTIVFKCGTDVVWIDPRANLRAHTLYNRDQWCHDTERDMGLITTHGRFVHLYLNGLYWGLYDMMERPDASFMAHYLGDDKENYDVINHSEVIDGDRHAWDAAIALANSGSSRGYDNFWYQDMQNWIDVDNLCDFILNQFYNGNIDWAGGNGNNWYVASVRIRDGSGNPLGADFKNFIWDAEHTLADGFTSDDPYWDAIAHFNNHDSRPSRFFGTLRNNAEFAMRFADHVHKHLFNDGSLTVTKATDRFVDRCNELDRAIVGESARWGNLRQSPSYTRDDWVVERDRLLSTYFPYRTGIFIGHLKNHDLYPNIDAPVFNQHGGHVPVSFKLTMSASDTIYYTLDGNDPRVPGGAVNTDADIYGPAIALNETTHVKARAKNGSTWSALNEAIFAVGPVKDYLRITEIMYHPQDTNDPNDPNEEFIELKNIGPQAINLNLVRFTKGVTFTFPSVALNRGQYVLVVRDSAAFYAQYPTFSGLIAGEYIGNSANEGEKVQLEDAVGQVIHEFRYRDGWYDITDGMGFSLTIKDPCSADPNQWDSKSGWRPSAAVGGSPGWDDTGEIPPLGSVKINELLAHAHGAEPDWIELHNTTDEPINIGGWFLSDSQDNLTKYEIAEGTFIDPCDYIVFFEDTNFANPSDPGCHVPFALSENGDEVYLHSGRDGVLTGYSEEEAFDASETGIAFGRYKKSTGTYNFVAMSANTPWQRNAYPKVGPIVINEIMYNPDPNVASSDAEYVELLNISGSPVALQEYDNEQHIYVPWRFADEDETIRFDFPLGTTMAVGEYLLLVKDKPIFSSHYPGVPGGVKIFQWGAGKLNNGGEKIELSKPGDQAQGVRYYIQVDRINYSDGYHPVGEDLWPKKADGSGASLNRIFRSGYGNDPNNWEAATPSPGKVNP